MTKKKVHYEPTLYVKTETPGKFKSIYGANVKPVKLDSMGDARDFVKKYESVNGVHIFGQTRYQHAFINETYPGEIQYDYNALNIFSLDIETRVPVDENGKPNGFPNVETADCEVNLITLENIHTRELRTFGCRDYKGTDTKFIICIDEKDLLRQFIQYWQGIDLDIVTGWNITYFDIPYLIARIRRVLGDEFAKMLSPWNSIDLSKSKFRGKEELTVSIDGIAILDFLELYRKFTYVKQESYSLAHIAQEELGHTKLDHSEFKDFNEFADKGWDKFVSYNVIDVKLVSKLEKKLQLINLAVTLSYIFKINYDEVYGPVKMWDNLIVNFLLDENVVVPMRDSNNGSVDDEGIEGAYVKEPIPGMRKWMVTLDATSLYPSNAMTLNMSPDTYLGQTEINMQMLLDGLQPKIPENECWSPIGAKFDKTKRGILPRLFETFMKNRKIAKSTMLDFQKKEAAILSEINKRKK